MTLPLPDEFYNIAAVVFCWLIVYTFTAFPTDFFRLTLVSCLAFFQQSAVIDGLTQYQLSFVPYGVGMAMVIWALWLFPFMLVKLLYALWSVTVWGVGFFFELSKKLDG